MEFVKIFNGKAHEGAKNIDNHFEFECDEFQKEANYNISIQENVLLCAHTGSGKTVPAIFAIHEAFKHNKKVIYTSPIKTLSNQKYDELRNIFDDVGIMTGDIKLNPDAQCIIMTTEILRNILYKNGNESIQPEHIGYVIFDEVHYFNDPHRGKVWEECIMLLDPKVVLVMLSATIDKPELFASWVGNLKQKNISLISTHHRVVPLTHYFYDIKDERLIKIVDSNKVFKNYEIIKKNYNRISHITQFLPHFIDNLIKYNHTPTLFFKFSRLQCEKYANSVQKNLLNSEEMKELTTLYKSLVGPYKKQYEHLNQFNVIEKLIFKGVCYHHSGLIPILKEIVEIIYGKGLIKVLFATETFAVGVNKPVKTVVFSDLQKYDNNGMRYLRSDEYTQMAGRAGRRGLDKFGTIIILPNFELPSLYQLQNILIGKAPCMNSKFGLTYQFIIKNLMNKHNIIEVLKNSYLQNELNTDIKNTEFELDKNKKLLENIDVTFDIELYDKYENIKNKMGNSFIKPSQKQMKQYRKDIKNITSQPNFEKDYDKYMEYTKVKKEIKDNEEQLNNFRIYFDNHYNILTNILKENEFVNNELEPTLKGLIAVKTNECHELILANMVYNGFFNDKSCEDIILYISLFIEEEKDENCYFSDYPLSNDFKNGIQEIQKMFEHFNNIELKYSLNMDYQKDINIAFLMPVYVWIHNLPIGDIYKYTNMYEGNFVKGILKINNIIEDVKTMLEMCGFIDTLKVLENSESLLIKDFVSVSSLYVN